MYSTEPRHYQPSLVQVKNTFIDIPEQGIDHDDGIDLNKLRADMLRRQVSDPGSTCFARQLSGVTTPLPRAPEDEVVMEHGHTGALPGGDAAPPECALLGGGAAPPEADGYRTDSYGPLHFSGQAPASHQATPLAVAAHCAGRSAAAVEAQSAGLPPEWREARTAMMRNLPNKYTQHMLLEELNKSGFLGTFDFLYLPIDPDTNANRGYAFINFISPGSAWMLRMTYEGRKMSRFNSDKVVSVSPAALQGFEANYAHYSTARVSRGDPALRPLFLRESDIKGTLLKSGPGRRRGGRRSAGSLIDVAARQHQTRQHQQAPTAPGSAVYFGLNTGPGAGGKKQCGPSAAEPSGLSGKQSNLVAKFCPYCGGACQPEHKFCKFCGASLAFQSRQD